MLERYLVEHCSPTLASLKTASLFTLECACEAELEADLRAWNALFADKGIMLSVLQKNNNRVLIYVCRKSCLQRDLQHPDVARFLQAYGYDKTDADTAIATLKSRLEQSSEFPHEIGLFLGYPLGDVVGFIQNAGRNCKCTGCWKVYCDECAALKTFARYKKCKDVYMRLWKQGRSVWQLTVAA